MAEAIGLILGIAGLYSACIDAFEQIRSARSFGRDYEILSTRFDVRKARLLQWGDGVGLLHNAEEGRNAYLDSPNLRPAVERVLHCIQMLLTDTESFKSKYGLQEVLEDEANETTSPAGAMISHRRRNLFQTSYASFKSKYVLQGKSGTGEQDPDSSTDALTSRRRRDVFKDSYHKFSARILKQQNESSLKIKTQWAIAGRKEFENLISDLEGLIEDLYKLVPVPPAFKRLMVKEDINTLPDDLAALKLVQEACAIDASGDTQDPWLEAASVRVEATELGTSDRRHINEWLVDTTTASPGAPSPPSPLSEQKDRDPLRSAPSKQSVRPDSPLDSPRTSMYPLPAQIPQKATPSPAMPMPQEERPVKPLVQSPQADEQASAATASFRGAQHRLPPSPGPTHSSSLQADKQASAATTSTREDQYPLPPPLRAPGYSYSPRLQWVQHSPDLRRDRGVPPNPYARPLSPYHFTGSYPYPPPPATGSYPYHQPQQGAANDPYPPPQQGINSYPYPPSQNPHTSPAPVPRQRTAIACKYCRKRKIRCAGYEASPDGRCQNCVRFNQQCLFQPVSSQNASTPASARQRPGDYQPWRGDHSRDREPPVLYGAHGQPLGPADSREPPPGWYPPPPSGPADSREPPPGWYPPPPFNYPSQSYPKSRKRSRPDDDPYNESAGSSHSPNPYSPHHSPYYPAPKNDYRDSGNSPSTSTISHNSHASAGYYANGAKSRASPPAGLGPDSPRALSAHNDGTNPMSTSRGKTQDQIAPARVFSPSPHPPDLCLGPAFSI